MIGLTEGAKNPTRMEKRKALPEESLFSASAFFFLKKKENISVDYF